MEAAAPTRSRRISPAMRQTDRVSPLELFFDLVFVLAITQCTALMADNPSWEGVGQGLLVLALLSVSLCVPEAWGGLALEFALAYGAVRAAHIAVFAIASHDEPEFRRSVIGLGIGTGVGITLLVAGALAGGWGQAALWGLALVLDVGEPYLFGAEAGLTWGITAAAAAGILLTCAMWWAYFDVVAVVAGRRLARAPAGKERNEMARDSYSYLHFAMVAGIVLVALGLKKTIGDVDDPLKTVPAFALLGGVALYLLGHVAFRFRHIHTVNRQRLGLALLLLAAVPLATGASALAAVTAVTVALWAMIAYETHTYGERRRELRAEVAR